MPNKLNNYKTIPQNYCKELFFFYFFFFFLVLLVLLLLLLVLLLLLLTLLSVLSNDLKQSMDFFRIDSIPRWTRELKYKKNVVDDISSKFDGGDDEERT